MMSIPSAAVVEEEVEELLRPQVLGDRDDRRRRRSPIARATHVPVSDMGSAMIAPLPSASPFSIFSIPSKRNVSSTRSSVHSNTWNESNQ